MEPMTHRLRTPAIALILAALSGCPRGSEEAPPVAPDEPGEIWLDVSCDLPAQLESAVADLRRRGVVEVTGGQPYRWEFGCTGETLDVTVRLADVPSDGDPVLWLGAEAEPARVVPLRLHAGSGQPQLEQRVRRCDGGEEIRFHVDLATGVVWGDS